MYSKFSLDFNAAQELRAGLEVNCGLIGKEVEKYFENTKRTDGLRTKLVRNQLYCSVATSRHKHSVLERPRIKS